MDFNAVSLHWFSSRDEPKYQFIQRIKYRSDEISHTKQEKNAGNFSSPVLSHTLIKNKNKTDSFFSKSKQIEKQLHHENVDDVLDLYIIIKTMHTTIGNSFTPTADPNIGKLNQSLRSARHDFKI